MSEKKYKLLGLGSAIVDVISYGSLNFIKENKLQKGSMTLVDASTADSLYSKMTAATECSGGSSANTCAGFGILGGSTAFLGNVKNDYLGRVFKKEIEKARVDYPLKPSENGLSTSKCLIIVTEEELPGGRKKVERTMATYLEFDIIISPDDINEEIIKASEIIFFEGYLFDNPRSKEAVQKAIEIAKKVGTKIAFTLSDPNCIKRNKQDLLHIIKNYADVIFANEHEAEAVFDEPNIRKNLANFTGLKAVTCLTRGELGSYVIDSGKIYDIEPVRTDDVYDVTGAGDAYAAGFLYGYANGFTPEKSGKLASMCATEVIKYIGGRPNTDLSKLLKLI